VARLCVASKRGQFNSPVILTEVRRQPKRSRKPALSEAEEDPASVVFDKDVSQIFTLDIFTIVIPRSASEEESLQPPNPPPFPVILTEVRRQPNEAEGPGIVAAGKNLSTFFSSAVFNAWHSEEPRGGICLCVAG
jgi:hypothetical protein